MPHCKLVHVCYWLWPLNDQQGYRYRSLFPFVCNTLSPCDVLCIIQGSVCVFEMPDMIVGV